MTIVFCIELDDKYPKANDMLAIVVLIACPWVGEVFNLTVTGLIPMVLIPFCGISTSKNIASAYWGNTQMLFLGAFIVDISIVHVDFHKRIALKVLLLIGSNAVATLFSFMSVSYFLSMWCSNTVTTVMLVPFANGLLDTAKDMLREREDHGRIEEDLETMTGYNRGILIGIAYAATCGGIAMTIGTPPNGVLIDMPIVNDRIGTADWFQFAILSSFTLVVCAFFVVYLFFVRGVSIKLEKDFLREEYAKLGSMNRDEVIVAMVQVLQIFGYFIRVEIINNEEMTSPEDLTGILDSTIACTAAALPFMIPSVKPERDGQAIITWREAEEKLYWGIILLMGSGGAIAKGFSDSSLTKYVGDQLADAAKLSSISLQYLITCVVCFLTEITSNTATANIILPIMESVSYSTLIHPLRLMLATTVACSFAFMLPVATPPNIVVFATGRVSIKDLASAGLVMNILSICLVSAIIYAMGVVVYDINDPFPEYACSSSTSCFWLPIAGDVDGTQVTNQACWSSSDINVGFCKLFDGSQVNVSQFV